MKYKSLDKFDSHLPKRDQFIHDEPYISNSVDNFHMTVGTMWINGKKKPVSFGVCKREWNASSHGVCVDGSYIGKSDS